MFLKLLKEKFKNPSNELNLFVFILGTSWSKFLFAKEIDLKSLKYLSKLVASFLFILSIDVVFVSIDYGSGDVCFNECLHCSFYYLDEQASD